MCQDDKCPQREECYRYMAIPNKYDQSYFAETPRVWDKCEYFMPIQKRDKVKDE